MFAVKRKDPRYALAEQRRIEEQQRLSVAHAASQSATSEPVPVKRNEKLYLASEIISEEPAPVAVQQPEKVYCESEIIEEPELVPVEGYEQLESIEDLGSDLLEEDTPLLVDGDERPVGTSKLAKLPSLIDLMLTMNLSKSVRMNFAALLLKQYNKYKNFPEEKAILIKCLQKLIASLSKG